ncbi:MAG: DUF58 domain-containing protein [Thermodesulfovibrionales bacterium]
MSGFIGRRNIQGLEINITTPSEIYANTPSPVRITITNKKALLPSFLIRVSLLNKVTLLAFIDRKASSEKFIELTPYKRGLNEIGGISVCSVFPFNFFIRCRGIKESLNVIAFPEPLKFHLTYAGISERETKKGDTDTDNIGFGSELVSTRDYIIGDPLKYIHWKASARTDRLKTKEFSSLETEPVVIDFETLPYDTETNLSLATYLINQLYRLQIPFGLKIRGEMFPPACNLEHRLKLLKILALYDDK